MNKTYLADLKIGTSTVTESCSRDPAKLKKRHQKDSETTSAEFGYKLTGFEYKNLATGAVHSKHLKTPYLSHLQTKINLYSLFAYDINLFQNKQIIKDNNDISEIAENS